MGSANERRLYNIKSSLIGWAHTQNDLCYPGYPTKRPYPPCLRMADRALLAGYPRYIQCSLIIAHQIRPVLVRWHLYIETEPWAPRPGYIVCGKSALLWCPYNRWLMLLPGGSRTISNTVDDGAIDVSSSEGWYSSYPCWSIPRQRTTMTAIQTMTSIPKMLLTTA